MKRTAVVFVLVAVMVGLGCSGSDRSKPGPVQPTLVDSDPVAVTKPPAVAVDPTAVPPGTVASVSIGAPGALVADVGAYLTTAGLGTVVPQLSQVAKTTGLTFDKPIVLLVVMGQTGPETAIAGTPADKDDVRMFAQATGQTVITNDDGTVVIGPDPLLATTAPHLTWQLRQPMPAELQFEVAGQFVNMFLAAASAQLPNNPFAGFSGIAQLAGSLRFDANDATLKIVLIGQPDTGLTKFATSLAPSDFRLAAAAAAPGDTLFAAGTFDYRLVSDAMRPLLGPMLDVWAAVGEITDGSVAMVMREPGHMVALIGVPDAAKGAAAYETAIRAMATPVEFQNTTTIGRLRVKKIAKQWFHEIETGLTATATDAEREAMKRMSGGDKSRALMGVVDTVGISASGKQREKAIADVLARVKKAGAITSPTALAAVEESRLASEAFVLTADLAMVAGWSAPAGVKPVAASPTRPHFRLGLSRVGSAIGLRLVVPAQQVDAMRQLAP